LRISGPHTRELLAKGCSLDLHPRVFRTGHCAQTSLAHVGVLLHLPDAGGGIDLYCSRSYAQHLWHWLSEAAGEFGYEVVAPRGA
jgi:sarcosine oxidase subunit gamma